MGPFWFGQVSKSMVERDFNRFERPEAIGFSEGQFQTVVETLNDTAGNSLFGPKPVQQQRPVLAQHASHFLHRLDARAQGARTPAIQELPRPGGRTIVPEELEVLLEQVGADGLQVIAQQIRQLHFLFLRQVLGTFQQAPTGMGQHRFPPLRPQSPGFLGAHFIHRLVHMLQDMEAVQDMESLSGLARNHLEVGFPQVTTDETQPCRTRPAKPAKEAQQSFHAAVFPHPQQSLAALIDLIHQCQVLMALAPGHLIDPQGSDPGQLAVLQTPLHHPLHRVKDLFPRGVKDGGHLAPRKASRPETQELHIGRRQSVLARCPGHRLYFYPTALAVHPAQGINEEHCDPPQGHKLKIPSRQRVIAGACPLTPRADRTGVGARTYAHPQTRPLTVPSPFHLFIDKRFVLLNSIQNTLQLHPVPPALGFASHYPYRIGSGCATSSFEATKALLLPTNSAEEALLMTGRSDLTSNVTVRCINAELTCLVLGVFSASSPMALVMGLRSPSPCSKDSAAMFARSPCPL